MEPIFMAKFETTHHLYQAFGNTPEEAKKTLLRGYKRNCLRISHHVPNAREMAVEGLPEGICMHEIRMGECLIDNEDWL